MALLAIDIVLRLPEKLENIVIGLNTKNSNNITLSKDDFVPHISLLMGIIDEKNIKDISKIIHDIATKFNTLQLKILEFRQGMLTISNTSELFSLHVQLTEQLKPSLLKKKAEDILFVEGNLKTIDNDAKYYFERYTDEHSYENFDPHITTHTRQANDFSLPLSFTADTIGAYQLGDYCTCRKKLFETNFSSKKYL